MLGIFQTFSTRINYFAIHNIPPLSDPVMAVMLLDSYGIVNQWPLGEADPSCQPADSWLLQFSCSIPGSLSFPEGNTHNAQALRLTDGKGKNIIHEGDGRREITCDQLGVIVKTQRADKAFNSVKPSPAFNPGLLGLNWATVLCLGVFVCSVHILIRDVPIRIFWKLITDPDHAKQHLPNRIPIIRSVDTDWEVLLIQANGLVSVPSTDFNNHL